MIYRCGDKTNKLEIAVLLMIIITCISNLFCTFTGSKAFFWLVQNIAEWRSSLVSKSLPVKLTIFVSSLLSMGKKN